MEKTLKGVLLPQMFSEGRRSRGGRSAQREQAGPRQTEQGHSYGPTPLLPSALPEVLGDTDIPIWTLAQSFVAMATRWALWREEEGSGCVEFSVGSSSSVPLLLLMAFLSDEETFPLPSQEAKGTSGLSLLAPSAPISP